MDRLCWVVDGFFLGLWVTVVVGWLVAMGFVVGCAMDHHGLFRFSIWVLCLVVVWVEEDRLRGGEERMKRRIGETNRFFSFFVLYILF